jgi:hypothetical protein
MREQNDNLTAVEVIRCVWLARMASNQGDEETARRWQAKADAWVASRSSAEIGGVLEAGGPVSREPPTDAVTRQAS